MNAVVKQTAPIPSRKPRRWLRWMEWVTGGQVSLLLVLTGAGAAYQLVATNRDRRLNPPPGLLVDIGGYRMHLYCTGQGSPTVILDSGIGDSWLSWYKVQPQVGQFTRVCSYDRAGMGWSDPSPKARTSRESRWSCGSSCTIRGFRRPLYWWAIPSEGSTCGCTQSSSQPMSRVWCSSTQPRQPGAFSAGSQELQRKIPAQGGSKAKHHAVGDSSTHGMVWERAA